jgi:ABC-type oligopeptide transport system substrate-binding subunit
VALSGWLADYGDGVSYFGPLLDGDNVSQTGNQNYAYFDRPRYNREIERISRLTGGSRRRAWADLDVEMMRDDPPWAPVMNNAAREFVSKSVGCYVYQPVYGRLDLAAACKK